MKHLLHPQRRQEMKAMINYCFLAFEIDFFVVSIMSHRLVGYGSGWFRQVCHEVTKWYFEEVNNNLAYSENDTL